jgi:hypothetical protein
MYVHSALFIITSIIARLTFVPDNNDDSAIDLEMFRLDGASDDEVDPVEEAAAAMEAMSRGSPKTFKCLRCQRRACKSFKNSAKSFY